MTRIVADAMREEYLARLDDALRGLPHGTAVEIRAGISEELHGLDVGELSARIARLGEPTAIAREAHAEVRHGAGVVEPVFTAPQEKSSVTATRGFAIAAAITLSVGGFVVPVLGWVVGCVLVSLSSLWRTGEKIVAIIVPVVALAISAVVGGTFWGITDSSTSSGDGGAANPLVPTAYDVTWSGILVIALVLIPLSGIWLLWRLRGRSAR